MARSDVALLRLQSCLAIEHEAVWLYSYLGGRFAGLGAAARTSYNRHRRLRDELLALLHGSRASNPVPAADYALGTGTTAARASARARSLEARSASAWLSLIGVSEGSDRLLALEQLRAAAVAELDWGGKATAFPGLSS